MIVSSRIQLQFGETLGEINKPTFQLLLFSVSGVGSVSKTIQCIAIRNRDFPIAVHAPSKS